MQATVAPAQPTPPSAPAITEAPALAGSPTITYVGPDGVTQTITVPQSRQDVRAIEGVRRRLSEQINSAMGRREDVARDLRRASDPVDRQGLEQRLTVLDRRIAGLETDLAVTGRQLAAAPSRLSSGGSEAPIDIPDNVAAMTGVFTIFVIFPLVFVFARNLWRRGSIPKYQPAQLPADTTQRLERLEAGIEAIAIEMERVSEGQRFVTKLLSEAAPIAKMPVMANPEAISSKQ